MPFHGVRPFQLFVYRVSGCRSRQSSLKNNDSKCSVYYRKRNPHGVKKASTNRNLQSTNRDFAYFFIAYLIVHSLAILLYLQPQVFKQQKETPQRPYTHEARSRSNWRAMSGTKGSFGFGSVSSEQMESSTYRAKLLAKFFFKKSM